jgi:hypothetical protein
VTALPPLYQLTASLVSVMDALVEAGGELTPELQAQLEQAEGDFKTKVERVALGIRHLVVTGEAAATEASRLTLLARARLNASERLKDYLREQMLQAEQRKVETDRVRVSVVTNSRPTIKWLAAPDTIPEAFRRTKVELDGDAALQAYRDRGRLPEGFQVLVGTHLRIA